MNLVAKQMERIDGFRLLLLVTLASTACTTTMYQGPRRPQSEIASIGSEDTRINYVDGKYVRDDVWSGKNARYEFLPGRHSFGISLEASSYHVFYNKIRYSKTITRCLDAQPGHSYRTMAIIRDDTWAPIIADEVTGKVVDVSCWSKPTASASPSAPADSTISGFAQFPGTLMR